MVKAAGSHDGTGLRPTLLGGVAVLLWSLLALLTTGTEGLPPFQVLTLTFALAFALSITVLALRGRAALARLRQRPSAWLLATGGLFGFHFFYFVALKRAPPVEAGLIVYLWPPLIVLLSALLPGERLRWFHVCGAVMGLAGTVLLVRGAAGVDFDPDFALGYLAALAAAFAWSGYSVANRRFGDVPTEIIGGVCGIVALLGLACHLGWEETVIPGAAQWWAVAGLGIGPVGAAFFFWDHATKHRQIQAVGAMAYPAPPLSTLFLIGAGQGELTWTVAAACLLIVLGAVLAARDLLLR